MIAIGYGLAGRLLPGVVDQEASRQALGRLDQPLTYWNAVGAVAALGLVLCARLACGRAQTRRGAELEDEGWVEVGRRVDVVERRRGRGAPLGVRDWAERWPRRPARRSARGST